MITSSYNNIWNSQFVGETPREEAWRKLFTTMTTHGIPMLRRQFSHSFIDLVTFWSSLCQKYQTILELESSSCITRASIRLEYLKPLKAKDYKWAFQASLAWPNLRLTGSCRLFRERYMKDRSHGKQLCLSSAKLRAVSSKPTLFIANFRWTFAELSFWSENSTK